MDWHIVIVLLISGTAVGIINTLAGGGSIITMTMFMAFGLPINVANGTRVSAPRGTDGRPVVRSAT